MDDPEATRQAPLAHVAEAAAIPGIDPVTHSLADWEVARRRLEAIQPLLLHRNSAAAMLARSAECGVAVVTLYRWMRQYKRSSTLSSLLDGKKSGGRGVSRLVPEQDHVIQEAIKSSYLTPQRRRARTICRIVAARCKELDIIPPHANTVRNRIAMIAPELATRRRLGADSARALRPIEGSFPYPERPLGVVQIDHTPLDIILVDEEHRKPVGRPWITVALDVYSRMVTGYHISFEPPGSLTTAICIAHSISRKDEWLAKYNIEGEWPCSGIMNCIHVDNAREFHSDVLKIACMEYGIDLQHRPPGRPQYGGNIERFLGTLARELHELDGSTFSNTSDRKGYDSDKHSTFTLEALRLWVAKYLIEVYHRSFHSSLKTTPLAHFKAGLTRLFLTGEVPQTPRDFQKLELDFLPGTQRAVQRYGIQIDRLRYWHDVLRAWVNARDPKNKAKKRLFWVKRDPRDIKFVYFLDPLSKSYHRIPCRDTALPSVSLSQYKIAEAMMRREGRKHVNVAQLEKSFSQLEKIQEKEGGATRSVRRAIERRRSTPILHGQRPETKTDLSLQLPSKVKPSSPVSIDLASLTPFEGYED